MSRAAVIVAALIGLAGAGQGADVVYFEQRAAGSASGDLYVEGLGGKSLRVRTPGRPDLHAGVKRMGDRALIRIVDDGKREDAAELKILLLHGDAERTLTFPLAAAEKEEAPADEPPAAAADPAEKLPEAPVRNEPVPGTELAPEKRLAAAASPGFGGSSAPVLNPCPVLIVTPGSLYATVARLAGECGHALGRWTPGDEEVLLDFEVDELAIVDNPDGVQGLLDLLREYGLVGLIRPGARLIDIFEHRKTELRP